MWLHWMLFQFFLHKERHVIHWQIYLECCTDISLCLLASCCSALLIFHSRLIFFLFTCIFFYCQHCIRERFLRAMASCTARAGRIWEHGPTAHHWLLPAPHGVSGPGSAGSWRMHWLGRYVHQRSKGITSHRVSCKYKQYVKLLRANSNLWTPK